MQAVIYCRISKEKNTQDLSLDSQERICRNFASDNKLNVIHVEKETASAYKNKTKNLGQIIQNYRNTIIIVKCVDRFSRNVDEAIALLRCAVRQKNRIVFVQNGIVFHNNETGNKIVHLVKQAENESKQLASRLRDIYNHKKSLGLHTGGVVKFGYAIQKTHLGNKLVEHEHEQDIIRFINYLRLDENKKPVSQINNLCGKITMMDTPIVFEDNDGEESKHVDGYMPCSAIAELLNDYFITYRGKKWTAQFVSYVSTKTQDGQLSETFKKSLVIDKC